MDNVNSDKQIQELRERISQLESELQRTQIKLDDCYAGNHETHLQKTSQESLEYKERQHKLFSVFKICEANWSDIPEDLRSTGLENPPAFKMLNTPVTFEMFDLYCAATGQQPPGDEGWGRENRPVINVNYQDALTYSRWLSEQTGWHCLLPTEEQWEYACKAGTVTNFWYGDAPDPRMMVMGTGKTMPTPGTRMANPWDLYDMHGNVWEWTASSKGDEFILCGGSWYNKANWLTSKARNISYPNFSHNNWGFRLIRY